MCRHFNPGGIMKKISVFIALLLVFACAKRIEKKANVAQLRVSILDCGQVLVRDISIFSPGFDKGKTKTLTDSCYVIEHPKGRMIWDTGLNDALLQKPNGVDVWEGKFNLSVKKGLRNQLKELGLTPADFDFVGISHFHMDHVGNAPLFTKAAVLVQKEEQETALAADAVKKGMDAGFVSWFKTAKVTPLTGDYDVFGDGTVVIKKMPGHTPGHQSLFLNLPKTGPVLLTGDLYHFTKNRQFKRVPSFNTDKKATLKSMKAFEAFVSAKKAQVWIQHDLEQNQTLAHAPAFFE